MITVEIYTAKECWEISKECKRMSQAIRYMNECIEDGYDTRLTYTRYDHGTPLPKGTYGG